MNSCLILSPLAPEACLFTIGAYIYLAICVVIIDGRLLDPVVVLPIL